MLIFCFLFFTTTTFGQQFLWTTLKDSTIKYVPLENVIEKVLEFYDHYQYHYDGSGYSKDGFFKKFESSQSFNTENTLRWKSLEKKIYEIESSTVIAFKDNLGHGSVIQVICISKENVNLITFSNNFEEDAITNYPIDRDRDKFAKFFKTLLE